MRYIPTYTYNKKLSPTLLWVLRGNRTFFFSWRFHWNSDKKWRFHVLVWSKNLKPVVVSLKPGVFGEVGGRRPPISPKYPRFRWIPPQVFKFLLQTNTWIPPFFCPSFNEYRQEKNKKYVRVSNETIHLLFFDKIFTHEYHQFSANSFKISLKKKMFKPQMVSQKLLKIKNTGSFWNVLW